MKTTGKKQIAVLESTDKLTIPQIKAKMIDGDPQIIHQVTGYSVDYIRKCMEERRNNRLVVAVAEQLVLNRDKFIQSMRSIAKLIREDKYPVAK